LVSLTKRPWLLANFGRLLQDFKYFFLSSIKPVLTIILGLLKQVMSNRFNAETGCLNLSRFHNDSAFLGQDVYVPLSRSSVMSNVVKIINENVPQVKWFLRLG
jgi:hypothetical protein